MKLYEKFIQAIKDKDIPKCEQYLQLDEVTVEFDENYKPIFVNLAKSNCKALIDLVLKNQAIYDEIVCRGNLILQIAADEGCLYMVKALLKYAEVFFEVDGNGNLPLKIAILKQHDEIVAELLAIDAVCNSVSIEFLLYATQIKNIKIVHMLLALPTIQTSINDEYNSECILKKLARSSSLEIMQLLLTNYKILQDNLSVNNGAVLEYAIWDGDLAKVKYLLQYKELKENVAAYNNAYAREALHCKQADIFSLLLEYEAVRDKIEAGSNSIGLLAAAAESGYVGAMMFLLQYLVVLEDVAIYDNFLLKSAVDMGHICIVEELLRYKAVRDNLTVDSNKILRKAVFYKHIDIAILLLKYPSVINTIAIDNNVVLLEAVSGGDVNIVKLLFKYKDVLNGLDPVYDRCLGEAIVNGNMEIVQLFFEFIPITENNLNLYEDKLKSLLIKNSGVAVIKFFLTTYVEAVDIVANIIRTSGLGFGSLTEIEKVKLLLGYKKIKNALIDSKVLLMTVGEPVIVSKRIEIFKLLLSCEEIAKKIADNDNEFFAEVAKINNIELTKFLLKHEEVRNNIAVNDNKILYSLHKYSYFKKCLYEGRKKLELFLKYDKVRSNIAAKNDRILRKYCVDTEVDIGKVRALAEVYKEKEFIIPVKIKAHKNILRGIIGMNKRFKKTAYKIDNYLWHTFSIPREISSLIFIYAQHLKNVKKKNIFFEFDEKIEQLNRFWSAAELKFIRGMKEKPEVVIEEMELSRKDMKDMKVMEDIQDIEVIEVIEVGEEKQALLPEKETNMGKVSNDVEKAQKKKCCLLM